MVCTIAGEPYTYDERALLPESQKYKNVPVYHHVSKYNDSPVYSVIRAQRPSNWYFKEESVKAASTRLFTLT